MTDPEICRVAFVGAGAMAREHARAFSSIPSVRLTGVYSRSEARAKALAGDFGMPVYASLEELYSRSQPHLVVIAVSVAGMADVAHRCLEFPWTILLEKPPAHDLAAAEALQRSAAAARSRVRVALNRRFYSSTREVLAQLADTSGSRYVRVQDQEDMTEARRAGHPDVVVRNWMFANSIHLIDYFHVFARGELRSVSRLAPWRDGSSDVVVAFLEFTSGDIGVYEGVWNGPAPWAVNVQTTDCRWELRPLEEAGVQARGERRLRPIPSHERDRTFKAGFQLQAEAAVAAALGRQSDVPTLDDAIETMRLVSAIFDVNR